MGQASILNDKVLRESLNSIEKGHSQGTKKGYKTSYLLVSTIIASRLITSSIIEYI
jgi:hypothetical protein